MKQYLLLAITALFSLINLNANPLQDISNLARLTGSTNEGTEFYLTFHPGWLANSKISTVKIYVASRTQATVNLEIPGLGHTNQRTILPNQQGQFTLTPEQAMMYTNPGWPAIKPEPAKSWEGRAIHITSDVPIVCYGLFDGLYTGEGFMAIPVKNWGNEYKVASYADPTNNDAQYLPGFTSIIAAYDSTKIEFKVGGTESMAIPLENGTDLKAGEKLNVTLNKGDVYLIPGKYAYHDLSGSYVKADKPVGVISGNYCAYVPTEVAACDYTIEMEQPYFSWGKKCYIPTIESRLKNPILKIFIQDAPTSIIKVGDTLGILVESNGLRNKGWIERRNDTGSPHPTVYSGNKPINVVLYNTGQQDDNKESDPFQMNIIPVDQFQNDILFEIPNYEKNQPFTNTYLSLIYSTSLEGVIPDDIELGWADSVGFNWRRLNKLVTDPGKKIETDTSGMIWMELHYKLPGYTCYQLHAKNNFGAYCYGYGNDKSFGYPAAGIYFHYDEADTLPPHCKYKTDSLGNISGIIFDYSNNIFKIAGLSNVYMDNTVSYNFTFHRDSIVSISDTLNFSLEAIDNELDAYAEIHATDKNGNDTTFTFGYTPPNVYPIIESRSFFLGYSKINKIISKQNIFVKDTSSLKHTYNVDSIILKNNTKGYKVIPGVAQGKSLVPLDSLPFSIEFSSDTEGQYVDSIGIKAHNKIIYYAEIKTIVTHSIIQTDSVIDFQEQFMDGLTSVREFTISNPSKLDLYITGIIPPSEDAFSVESVTFNTQNPLILVPGKESKLSVIFSPKEERNYSDSIKIISDGEGSNTIILKGKGVVDNVQEPDISDNLQLISSNWEIRFKSNINIIAKSIELFDVRGVKILEMKPENYLENIHINTNNLPSGLYIIQINSGIETYIESYIKIN